MSSNFTNRDCPHCGRKRIPTSKYINTICPSCGSKYYVHLKQWLNRKTGEYKND